MAVFNLGRGLDPKYYDAVYEQERGARIAPFRRLAREASATAASTTLGASRHGNPFLAGRQAALASARAAAPILQRQAEVEQAVTADQFARIRAEREQERRQAERMLGVGLSAAGAVGGTLLQAMPSIMGNNQQTPQRVAPSPLTQLGAPNPGASAMTTPSPRGSWSPTMSTPPEAQMAEAQGTAHPPRLGAADMPQTMGAVDSALGLAPPTPTPAPAAPGPIGGATVYPPYMVVPTTPTADAILADPGIQQATDQIQVPAPPMGAQAVGPGGMIPGAAPTPGAPGAIAERPGPSASGFLGGLAPMLSMIPGVGTALGAAAGIGSSIGSSIEEEERRRRMLGR